MMSPKFFFSMLKKSNFLIHQSCKFSTNIKYTKSHEYIKLENGVGTIGITDHAANALGDIVFVELPAKGLKYKAGDSFGSVESVKAASDVYCPIAGEVIESNAALESNPGTVNESPLDAGWFIKIKVSDDGKKEFESLLDQSAYDKVKEEKH